MRSDPAAANEHGPAAQRCPGAPQVRHRGRGDLQHRARRHRGHFRHRRSEGQDQDAALQGGVARGADLAHARQQSSRRRAAAVPALSPAGSRISSRPPVVRVEAPIAGLNNSIPLAARGPFSSNGVTVPSGQVI
jgi:hypothetical protein